MGHMAWPLDQIIWKDCYDFMPSELIPKPSDAAPHQGVEGHDVETEIRPRPMEQELPSSLPSGVL